MKYWLKAVQAQELWTLVDRQIPAVVWQESRPQVTGLTCSHWHKCSLEMQLRLDLPHEPPSDRSVAARGLSLYERGRCAAESSLLSSRPRGTGSGWRCYEDRATLWKWSSPTERQGRERGDLMPDEDLTLKGFSETLRGAAISNGFGEERPEGV